ncbi:hypothetical protein ROZALSC1DRAFT_28556 [Rozella allomycis CSF55]|uniref:Uncharacterized protein n=1 Tax=Rozella allomycis (strain CSF55) TaxID=988480 RepID=A0A075B510_ROZAC|nr:hypothetical protein O9G_004847 [Rozella allomycis CSF55]RKP19894.1 hypothetical protein ROZALSC1DRAFT_28556 [Rozella allomycis CSF55]|eukprot:EPZ36628.1 hypothetical protein O9G_004847 [Rozella allomycis CSF55]
MIRPKEIDETRTINKFYKILDDEWQCLGQSEYLFTQVDEYLNPVLCVWSLAGMKCVLVNFSIPPNDHWVSRKDDLRVCFHCCNTNWVKRFPEFAATRYEKLTVYSEQYLSIPSICCCEFASKSEADDFMGYLHQAVLCAKKIAANKRLEQLLNYSSGFQGYDLRVVSEMGFTISIKDNNVLVCCDSCNYDASGDFNNCLDLSRINDTHYKYAMSRNLRCSNL